MNEQQLSESLASLLNRYAAAEGFEKEDVLIELERILESLGFTWTEGVWRKTN